MVAIAAERYYHKRMPVRRILQLGDPRLRTVSRPIAAASEATPILADLRDTLHEFRRSHGFGRGISAVQIGEAVRVIYIEFEGKTLSMVNPDYEWMSDATLRLWDDCFSFPQLMVWLQRSISVAVRYQDETGAECRLEASGSLSELLQHEMDHLDGILALDRAADRDSFCTREEFERRHCAAWIDAAGA